MNCELGGPLLLLFYDSFAVIFLFPSAFAKSIAKMFLFHVVCRVLWFRSDRILRLINHERASSSYAIPDTLRYFMS